MVGKWEEEKLGIGIAGTVVADKAGNEAAGETVLYEGGEGKRKARSEGKRKARCEVKGKAGSEAVDKAGSGVIE